MARSVNKVILVGNVGHLDIHYAQNQSVVASTSIATNHFSRDRQTGKPQERTEWHRVVFFNQLAVIVRDRVTKGCRLYIEGSLRSRVWKDQSGHNRNTTEIIAHEMEILISSKKSGILNRIEEDLSDINYEDIFSKNDSVSYDDEGLLF